MPLFAKKGTKNEQDFEQKTTLNFRKFTKKGTKKRHQKKALFWKKGTILPILGKKAPKKGTIRTEKVVLMVPFFGFLQILQKISKNDRKK